MVKTREKRRKEVRVSFPGHRGLLEVQEGTLD